MYIMFWPIIVSFRVNSVGQSVLYVMMRQPLLSLDGCNALPCQSGDADTCSSCTAELGSGTIAAGMQACSLSPFPFPMTSFFFPSGYPDSVSMCTHSPKGDFVCPWSFPRFLAPGGCPDSLAAHLPRPLAAQQPSAYQRSRPYALILFRAG